MDNKRDLIISVFAIWVIFTGAIIYYDMNRWKDNIPLSNCHLVEIKMIHDKPMCTTCKMYCEVK